MPATLERLVVPIEWKATDDDQILEGYASTFGNVDLGGDVVVKGAFTKTIENIKTNGIPLLADHVAATASVLGTIFDAVEDAKGLKIKARFSKAPSAQDTRVKLLEGHLNRMSIGYEVMDQAFDDKDGQRVRLLQEIKLWETSVVVFPMNPEAVISRVKSIADALESDDREAFYATVLEEVKAEREAEAGGAPEGKATVNEAREALQAALLEHHKATNEWAYLRDFDDSKVWYEVHGGDSPRGVIYERDYSMDDDTAKVSLGETATKVRVVVSYVPVDESDDSKGVTLRLGADAPNDSTGGEPGGLGDEPGEKAAGPAATEGDEPSDTSGEDVKGWDRWDSEAVLNGRPTGRVDDVKRSELAMRLRLAEDAVSD